jgi:hypothetical protein
MMMSTRATALVLQSAINARLGHSGTLERDVFDGVSQGPAASVANGALSFHHNDRLGIEELERVGSVFAESELQRGT